MQPADGLVTRIHDSFHSSRLLALKPNPSTTQVARAPSCLLHQGTHMVCGTGQHKHKLHDTGEPRWAGTFKHTCLRSQVLFLVESNGLAAPQEHLLSIGQPEIRGNLHGYQSLWPGPLCSEMLQQAWRARGFITWSGAQETSLARHPFNTWSLGLLLCTHTQEYPSCSQKAVG